MTIKDSISLLIEKNETVCAFVEKAFRSEKSADNVIMDYVDFLQKSNYNGALSFSFIDALRFCSDPTLCEQFENMDVQQLFESTVRLNQNTFDVFLEAAKFEMERVGDKVKAKKFVEEGIKELEIRLTELKELLTDLES